MRPEQRVQAIEKRLLDGLKPDSLQVEDESHLHQGHEGAKDGRGHFRVLIVSERFSGLSLIQRHRAVYEALGELMQTDIHALSVEAFTADEL